MSRKIIAITVNTNPTRWVQNIFPRPNNQIGVELTENKNLAHDFGSAGYADSIIPRIFNPFERMFKAEHIMVSQPRPIGTIMEDAIMQKSTIR